MVRPSVAIAHDYLTQRGTAERVALMMARAFPEAPIHTTVYDPDAAFPEFRERRVLTATDAAPLLPRDDQRLGLGMYRRTLEQAPAIEADVLLASTMGLAHRFRTRGRQLIYVHPTAGFLRSADEALRRTAAGRALRVLNPFPRRERAGSDRFVASTSVVKTRLAELYGIAADVLPAPPPGAALTPPVEVSGLLDWQHGFHLMVSRLVAHRNVDKAIEAFRQLPDERLIVVGDGPLGDDFRRDLPPNVRLVAGLDDGELAWCYTHATALLVPSRDEYGHAPLEAAYAGTPTLALRAGGLVDTVREGLNGAFFDAPTPEAIAAAVRRSRDRGWDPGSIRAHAESMSEDRFIAALRAHVAELSR